MQHWGNGKSSADRNLTYIQKIADDCNRQYSRIREFIRGGRGTSFNNDKGREIMPMLKQTIRAWTDILTAGFTDEEKRSTDDLLWF
jgi:hypothetical protein